MDPDPQIVYDPTGEQVDFMDDCLYEEWKRAQQAGKGTSKSSPLDKCDLDHVQDKQWGGIVKGPLVWLDAAVNRELGRQMNDGDNAEIDVAKDFELECP